MKKFLALILTLAMVLSVCSFAAADDLPTITIMFHGSNVSDDSAVLEKVNEYIADKIDVQISLTDVGSGEYTDKANLALANNEINLLWTASWESVIGTNDLVPANAVYDITDLLPGTALYESMDEGQW